MLNKKIIELYESQNFDEFKDYVSSLDVEVLSKELEKIDKPLLVPIISKFPEEKFSDVFVRLPKELQN